MVRKKKCGDQLLTRLTSVLNDEKIPFDKKVLAELIIKHFPDFRRTINELQRYSVRGKIDSGILFTLSEANNKELITTLKEKRFNDMRKWVVSNIDKEPTSMFRNIYEVLHKSLDPKSIPQSVLILIGYQYKAALLQTKKSIWLLVLQDNGKL